MSEKADTAKQSIRRNGAKVEGNKVVYGAMRMMSMNLSDLYDKAPQEIQNRGKNTNANKSFGIGV